MKKLLLLLLLMGFTFGQTDNIGSQPFNETAVQLFHGGYNKLFSDGTYLFKSYDDRSTVDTSGFYLTDTTCGAALGSRLLQGGEIITSSAADIGLLEGMVDSGYTIVIDSSGYLLGVPRTVYGWGHDLTFSATDYNTVSWTSGHIYFANLDTFDIDAGNTGNMSDPTWIYFDEDVSETVLQITTEAGASIGLGRIIVCVAEDVTSPKDAVFQVFGGVGNGILIVADNIAANTITGNEILANSITTNEILFGSLNQDSLIASINADANGLYINAENIQIGGATTFATGYNPSDGNYVIYALTAPTERPSTDPLQNGDTWIDSTAAEGNVPKVWTGSEWRTAFTYINGGYIRTGYIRSDVLVADSIKTGTIDADVVNVTNLDADNITTGTLTGIEVKAVSGNDSTLINSGGISFYNTGGNAQAIDFYYGGTQTGDINVRKTASGDLITLRTLNGKDILIDSADKLYISSTNGIVLNDFASYQVNIDGNFFGYMTADSTLRTSADNEFSGNWTEDIDVGADCANGVFTADEDGYYTFTFHATVSGVDANTWYKLTITANGRAYESWGESLATGYETIELNLPNIWLDEGDSVVPRIELESNTATVKGTRAKTWFGGHRIR